MIRRVAAAFLATALSACSAAAAERIIDRYPGAARSYGVVIDGELVWGRALDTPRSPASLAKLLMALVLLDERWDDALPVAISAAAAAIEGTRAGLRQSERLRAGDALTAVLVRSANDACVALAEFHSGTLASFAQRMNERARRLGMRESHFGHPCGLEAPGQVTTVRDLLRLGAAALAEPRIARRAALGEARIATLGGRSLELRSSNALLGRVDGVIGLKSGYTSHAGRCLIAVAVRGGHHVWVVMLDAPDRWWVTGGIIQAAFDVATGLDVP